MSQKMLPPTEKNLLSTPKCCVIPEHRKVGFHGTGPPIPLVSLENLTKNCSVDQILSPIDISRVALLPASWGAAH